MYDNEYILYINRYYEQRLDTYEYLKCINIINDKENEEKENTEN